MEESGNTQLELHFDPENEELVRGAWEEIRVDFLDLWKQLEALLDRQHLSLGHVVVEECFTKDIPAIAEASEPLAKEELVIRPPSFAIASDPRAEGTRALSEDGWTTIEEKICTTKPL